MVYTLQSKKNSKPGARILAFLFCLFFSVNRWSPGGTVSSPGSGQACAHAQDSTRRWDSYYWQLLCNYCSVTVVTQTLRILMSHTSLPLCFTSHPKWKHVGPSLSWWFRFHGESHVQCIFLRGISLTVLLFWLVVLYVLVLSVETWKPKGFWLVVPRGKFDSTNQKLYPDLGSDASSVWKFCAPFSDVIWRGNQW